MNETDTPCRRIVRYILKGVIVCRRVSDVHDERHAGAGRGDGRGVRLPAGGGVRRAGVAGGGRGRAAHVQLALRRHRGRLRVLHLAPLHRVRRLRARRQRVRAPGTLPRISRGRPARTTLVPDDDAKLTSRTLRSRRCGRWTGGAGSRCPPPPASPQVSYAPIIYIVLHFTVRYSYY